MKTLLLIASLTTLTGYASEITGSQLIKELQHANFDDLGELNKPHNGNWGCTISIETQSDPGREPVHSFMIKSEKGETLRDFSFFDHSKIKTFYHGNSGVNFDIYAIGSSRLEIIQCEDGVCDDYRIDDLECSMPSA